MIYLSFDESFRNTGYTIFKEIELINHGIITTKKNEKKKTVYDSDKEQCLYLYKELATLIKTIKPQTIFFEKLTGGSQNAVANKLLSYIRLIFFLLEKDFPNIQFKPITTKESKEIIKTNASKKEVMDYVNKKYSYFNKFKLPNKLFEHIADSVIIFEAGYKKYFEKPSWFYYF